MEPQLLKMLYLWFVMPEFSLFFFTVTFCIGFHFMQICFTNIKKYMDFFFLRLKGKWNGKPGNGSGLKNAVTQF